MEISFAAKCSDLFRGVITGENTLELDGEVPGFLGGPDYVRLNIDVETGQIIDWNPEKVKEFIRQNENEE